MGGGSSKTRTTPASDTDNIVIREKEQIGVVNTDEISFFPLHVRSSYTVMTVFLVIIFLILCVRLCRSQNIKAFISFWCPTRLQTPDSAQPAIDVEIGQIVPGETQRQEVNSLISQANHRILKTKWLLMSEGVLGDKHMDWKKTTG